MARWGIHHIPLYDYLPRGGVSDILHAYNDILQPTSFRIVHHGMKTIPCQQLRSVGIKQGILICEKRGFDLWSGNTTKRKATKGFFEKVTIQIATDKDKNAWRNTICHEIGHALGIPKGHRADPIESCMGNMSKREFPGVYESSQLLRIYDKDKRKRR